MKKKQFTKKFHNFGDGNISYIEWCNDTKLPGFQFSHATGFNSLTYKKLLEPLSKESHIRAIDARGHGFTETEAIPENMYDWAIYRDDLIRSVENFVEEKKEPIILGGHSMGGATIMQVAAARPDLVSGLVLIEPVLIPKLNLNLIKLGRKFPTSKVFPFIKFALSRADSTLKRRREFPSKEMIKKSYKGRGAFTTWQDGFLDDYINGGTEKEGDFYTNKKIAETYLKIINESEAKFQDKKEQIEQARNIWRKGFVAEEIENYCKNNSVMDTTETRHKGLLTGDDLATWSATIEKPCSYDYKNFTVCKTGPWGQGPVFLQQLALLENYDLDSLDENSPEFVHLVVEATKLAFADREAFYGDTNFNNVPMEMLLSKNYNKDRRKLITENASMEVRPGIIPGFGGNVVVRPKGQTAESFSKFDIGEPTVARFDEPLPNSLGETKGDTTHFDIIDKWGNMIAGTPSGGW